MNQNHILRVLLYSLVSCGLFALGFPAKIWAQTAGDAFLTIPSSPRSYALGQSNLAAQGAQAIGVNPANLNLPSQRYEIFTSYNNAIGSEQYTHIAGAYMLANPWKYLDVLGIGYTSLNSGNIQEADNQGNLTGNSFNAGSSAISLAASGPIMPDLRWGFTGKILQSSIAGYNSGATLAADIGATYNFSAYAKPMSVGVSFTNMGQSIKFLSQSDALPTAFDIGYAVHFGHLMAVVDLDQLINQHTTQFGIGAEYGLGPVAFRIGYRYQNSVSNLAAQNQNGLDNLLVNGLVFGIGINVGIVTLDYGVGQEASDYAVSQHVALTVRWGETGPAKTGEQPRQQTAQKTAVVRTLDQHLNQAQGLIIAGHYEEARAELQQAAEIVSDRDPNNIRYYELMGRMELAQNHLPEAHEYYVRAIRSNQTLGINGTATANAYAGMGFCLEKEDDIAYAVKFFTKALELKPDPDVRRLVENELKKLAAQTTPKP